MEKKKVKLFSAIALVALALLVVGVTYAYFQNQYGSASNADVNVTTYTTDVLTFTTGDDINLEADQTTFGKDKGSVSGATYARALLTANNKTNNAVEHYYLYLNIENNTFTYSVQDNKPELIMTITDKDGNEVKNIEGLTYTEVTDRTNKKVSGYDITTKSGLITIFNNRELVAEPKAEEKWNITITFVNYESDQNANAGKVLSAKLMIQKNKVADLISDVCSGGEALSSCITSLSQKSVSSVSKIYHHDESLANGAGDNSYRYAGGDTAHPAYYSCKYKDIDVSNIALENNKSLKGDCDSVSMLFSRYSLYVDKSINKMIANKTTVKWDNANNKCVTTNGEEVLNVSTQEALPQSLCNGYAYKVVTSEGESLWAGGIKIEELGPGEETLFTPEDKENQKPALYSCKYNGIDVENFENGINSSLKGDCSSVFKFSQMVGGSYIDKSLDKAIANKQTVKWDSKNKKCVTSTGADVDIELEEDCIGDAYFIDGEWYGNVVIENMGAGEETLVEPEKKGVNNFVCFGSDADVCPADNLYRIIGVFGDRVKLIKSDYATNSLLGTDGDYGGKYSNDSSNYKGNNLANIAGYKWNYKNNTNNVTGSNTWSTSLLNKTNLNQNFITNIGTEWANKIDMTTWKVGGNTFDNIAYVIPSVAYQNEIVNPVTTNSTDNKTEYSAKIGLMYVSDYGFAAAPSAWTTNLYYYYTKDIPNVNWLHMGLNEWTISRLAEYSDVAFYVNNTGRVGNLYVGFYAYPVRPVFYLTSSVNYVSGSGKAIDPIRIN